MGDLKLTLQELGIFPWTYSAFSNGKVKRTP